MSEDDRWYPVDDSLKEIVRKNGNHKYGKRFLAYYNYIQIAYWWECEEASNFIGEGGCAIFPRYWRPLPNPPEE